MGREEGGGGAAPQVRAGRGGAGAARPGLKRRVSAARSLPGPAPDQPTPMAPSGPAARCGERGGPAAAGKAAR